MTLLVVARAVTLYVIWGLPIAEPYDPPLPAWWNGGRVYTSPELHVGLRPAADWGNGAGLTIQFTAKTPW